MQNQHGNLQIALEGLETQVDDSNHSVSEIRLYPSLQTIPDTELFTQRNTEEIIKPEQMKNCICVLCEAHDTSTIFIRPQIKRSLITGLKKFRS